MPGRLHSCISSYELETNKGGELLQSIKALNEFDRKVCAPCLVHQGISSQEGHRTLKAEKLLLSIKALNKFGPKVTGARTGTYVASLHSLNGSA